MKKKKKLVGRRKPETMSFPVVSVTSRIQQESGKRATVPLQVVGPYGNSVKDQGEEAELTLITCENKGTMRLIVKCTMFEVSLTQE